MESILAFLSIHRAGARTAVSARTLLSALRFMESLLSFFRMHWDHESTPAPPRRGAISVGQFPSWEESGVGWSALGSWKASILNSCHELGLRTASAASGDPAYNLYVRCPH